MDYYQLRSPWEQSAALSAWKRDVAEGRVPLVQENERACNAPRSCHLWFPGWCDEEDRWPLHSGRPILNWNAKLFGVEERKGPWLDMPFMGGDRHLASPRLQRILSSAAPRKVQWLPFRLRDPYGKVIARKYAVANYLELRDVIDRKKSQLEPGEKWRLDRGGHFELRTLVLSRKKIGNAELFRVYGWRNTVVVNEDVRIAIEGSGVRGCSFARLPVEP